MDEADAVAMAESVVEPEAFGTVFERHATAVLRFVVRRIPPTEAEEVLAEVFRIAFERRAMFDTSRPLRPWLYGIAANVVATHHRSEARRLAAIARYASQADVTGASADTDPGDQATAAADAGSANARLLRALAALGSDERAVVLLRAWEDLEYAEIADALDVPIGTVRSRLSRARARLRAAMATDDDCMEEDT